MYVSWGICIIVLSEKVLLISPTYSDFFTTYKISLTDWKTLIPIILSVNPSRQLWMAIHWLTFSPIFFSICFNFLSRSSVSVYSFFFYLSQLTAPSTIPASSQPVSVLPAPCISLRTEFLVFCVETFSNMCIYSVVLGLGSLSFVL